MTRGTRALTRRWQKIDPSRYGSPVKISSPEIGLLPSDGLIKFRFPSFPSWFRGLPGGTGATSECPALTEATSNTCLIRDTHLHRFLLNTFVIVIYSPFRRAA